MRINSYKKNVEYNLSGDNLIEQYDVKTVLLQIVSLIGGALVCFLNEKNIRTLKYGRENEMFLY